MELSQQEIAVLRRRVGKYAREADPEEKAKMHDRARKLVEQLRRQFPGIEDAALAGFAASITDMVIDLHTCNARELVSTLDATFTAYTLVASQLVSVYDGEKGAPAPEDFPPEDPPREPEPAADQKQIDLSNTGMYL